MAEKTEYTCWIDAEVIQDEPGECPKCGSTLEPRTIGVEDSEPWDYNEWAKRGKALAKNQQQSNWEIGEWLLKGEPHFDSTPLFDWEDIPRASWPENKKEWDQRRIVDVYSEAEKITGLERNTLRDLASTARRFPRSVRSDALHWSHHRWLINLLPEASEEELKKWVDEAIEKNYTVSQLKQAVRSRTKLLPSDPIKQKSFRVTVPLKVWETLEKMRKGRDTTTQKIAAEILTEQLLTPEMQTEAELQEESWRLRLKARRREVGLKVAKLDNLGIQRGKANWQV